MIEKFDPVEMITVIGLIVLAGVSMWRGNFEIGLAVVSGLVGYLTKSTVGALKRNNNPPVNNN